MIILVGVAGFKHFAADSARRLRPTAEADGSGRRLRLTAQVDGCDRRLRPLAAAGS